MPMDVDDLLSEVRLRLRGAATDFDREKFERFFREPVNMLGVKALDQRKIAAVAGRALKDRPPGERNKFCNELWRSGVCEEGNVAIYTYARFGKQCQASEFKLFERWVDRYVTNWAHCDGVSLWLLGASIDNQPDLAKALPDWTKSTNRWKRRASAVALVPQARRGLMTSTILSVADRLIDDPDDMVQKGVGWLLKETYPKRRLEVLRFLKPRKSSMPRLVLRYAAEKMTARDRATILT
jgi:3-methyladenine DNA glycosylase AlkD